MGSRATWEAVPVIGKTAMPFLYQTRTLAATQWTRAPRIVTGICRRNLSRSGITAESNNRQENESGGGSRENNGLVITRVLRDFHDTVNKNIAPKVRKNKERIIGSQSVDKSVYPWGRNIMPVSSSGRPNDEFDEFKEAKTIAFEEPDESEEFYEETDAIDALTLKNDPHGERVSTITQSEKQAFQKIFADVFTKYRQGPGEAPLLKDSFEEIEQDWEEAQGKPKKVTNALGNIISKAVADSKRPSRLEMEEIVERYPEALRAAAATAIGLDLVKSHEVAVTVEESMDSERLEQLQNAERDRVEVLMRDAKTDFALWKVMEEEVFSLIRKLGLEDLDKVGADAPKEEASANKEAPAAKKGRKSKQKKESTDYPASTSKPSTIDPVEDGISSLALYGPLYPSYLLLGLRLLDRSFAKPSPLTLSILPKIKELGRISHVLGASTQLYNELVFIHWYRRDDFHGASRLLSEMETYGLDWDAETLETVERIYMMQKTTKEGQRGAVLQSLWNFPEFSPGIFKAWAARIRRAAEEKEEAGYSY